MDENLERIEVGLLLQGIYAQYGYDFRNYAYPVIRRRVWHRIQAERLETISGLQEKVLHDPSCVKRLVSDFSIAVTEMFRDPHFFLSLRQRILPRLHAWEAIRVWVAGCSSGEEVYSVSILLREEGLANRTEIYATDMNPDGLQKAQNGVYSLDVMQTYTSNYLRSGGRHVFSDYYTASSRGAAFRPELIEHVVFAQHNLATDRAFHTFHLILCRNVLIYFNGVLQKEVFDLFHQSLVTGGFLGLGDAESISISDIRDNYERADPLQKWYRRIK